MKNILKVLLLCVTTVYSQDTCVIWNFEDILDDGIGPCDDSNNWQHLTYDSISIPEPPDDLRGGTNYIAPVVGGSCGITNPISVTPEGVLEVNIYIEKDEDGEDEENACIEIRDSLSDDVLGRACTLTTWVNGWHRIEIGVNEISTEAYIFFQGRSYDGIIFLMDSMRYFDNTDVSQDCPIYDNEDSDGGNESSEPSEENENSDESEESDEENESSEPSEESENSDESDEENQTSELSEENENSDESEESDEENESSETSEENENSDESDNSDEVNQSSRTSEEEVEGDENEPPIILPTENNGLSIGAIIGIVVGSILVVIAVALLTYFLGLKQGTKKEPPPEYREDIRSHVMEIPRTITVPRVKIAGPETPPSDYHNGNSDPPIYKLEIHNHFSR